jgi:hypothetical protein
VEPLGSWWYPSAGCLIGRVGTSATPVNLLAKGGAKVRVLRRPAFIYNRNITQARTERHCAGSAAEASVAAPGGCAVGHLLAARHAHEPPLVAAPPAQLQRACWVSEATAPHGGGGGGDVRVQRPPASESAVLCARGTKPGWGSRAPGSGTLYQPPSGTQKGAGVGAGVAVRARSSAPGGQNPGGGPVHPAQAPSTNHPVAHRRVLELERVSQ